MSGDKSRHSKGLCGLEWVRTSVGHTWTEGNRGGYTEAHFSSHCVIKMRFSILSVMVVHDADDTISTKYHTFHGVSEDGSVGQMPPNREERKCGKEICFASPLTPFDFCG
ncbi:hypothetical protein ACTXT7_005692 [Hymenolepis weldensis]